MTSFRRFPLCLTVGATLLGLGAPVATAHSPEQTARTELLVAPSGAASASELETQLSSSGLEVEPVADSGVLRVRVRPADQARVQEQLDSMPTVASAERNIVVEPAALSNDPLVGDQWPLQNRGGLTAYGQATAGADIAISGAWASGAGAGTVVAVIDSGIDYGHLDLQGQLWANPAEAANGRDDDGDGLADDVHGWDFVEDDNRMDDATGHGTKVAGVIAARRGNGVGTTGAAPDTKLMVLRVFNDAGRGNLDDVIAAVDYAGRHGANVANLSLGGRAGGTLEYVARQHPRMLLVASAGNESSSLASYRAFPCQTPAPNVICVGATDARDTLSDFSNYSATDVDIAAPGSWVLTTVPTWFGAQTGYASGTSFAAAFVSSVAALIAAQRPTAPAAWTKERLMASATRVPALAGKVASGRLNATTALTGLPAAPSTPATPTVVKVQGSELEPASFQLTGGGAYECSVDGGPWAGCSSPYSPRVEVGEHALRVRARSVWDDISPISSTFWTQRPNFAPLRFIEMPAGSTTSTSALFRFATGAPYGLQCRLDADDWTTCSNGMRQLTGLARGEHTFVVMHRNAPAILSEPLVYRWTIETREGGGPVPQLPVPPAPLPETSDPAAPTPNQPSRRTERGSGPNTTERGTGTDRAKPGREPIKPSARAESAGESGAADERRATTPRPAATRAVGLRVRQLRATRRGRQLVVALRVDGDGAGRVRLMLATRRCTRGRGRCSTRTRTLMSDTAVSGPMQVALSLPRLGSGRQQLVARVGRSQRVVRIR